MTSVIISLFQVDYSDINELIEDEEGVEPMQQALSPTSYPMDPPPLPADIKTEVDTG